MYPIQLNIRIRIHIRYTYVSKSHVHIYASYIAAQQLETFGTCLCCHLTRHAFSRVTYINCCLLISVVGTWVLAKNGLIWMSPNPRWRRSILSLYHANLLVAQLCPWDALLMAASDATMIATSLLDSLQI